MPTRKRCLVVAEELFANDLDVPANCEDMSEEEVHAYYESGGQCNAAPSGGPLITLNDGRKMPQLGLGTWKSKPGEVKAAVIAAVKSGYRHIDCAAIYKNEEEVGAALTELFADGVVRRDELWITSKHVKAIERHACVVV